MLRPPFCLVKPPRSRPQKMGSRHQTTTMQAEPCRDIKSVSRHHQGLSRSRHQNQVATLLEAILCCDINFMSRHRFCPQWAFQVATPKIYIATSHTATHVATSYPCRDAVSAQQKQTRSRLHFLVATSLPTSTKPGRDLKSMSRPQNGPMTSLFFSYLLLEKYPKKIYTHHFFFHFPEHPIKFIKIYFIHFSSILHIVKP